ncbi:hypothetical protein GTA09_04970 [Rhodococcus hoagii]|nr:hypothetical protein [Prescottella equi]
MGTLGFLGCAGDVAVTASNIGTATLLNVPGEAKSGRPAMWAVDLCERFDSVDGVPVPAGGTVQFRDGASAIGNPVAVIDGFAKLTHVFDATGAHSITATFYGTGAYTASNSDAQDVNVALASVTDLATAPELVLPVVQFRERRSASRRAWSPHGPRTAPCSSSTATSRSARQSIRLDGGRVLRIPSVERGRTRSLRSTAVQRDSSNRPRSRECS